MRILVFGAGVIGSLYAARLRRAGHAVALLARGERLATLRKHGLIVAEGSDGPQERADVQVLEALDPQDPYDLVLVPVSYDKLDSVLPPLASSRATPNVLFFGNNPAGAQRLVSALGAGRVLLGFPSSGGKLEGPVVRFILILQQATTLGEPNGKRTDRVRRIAGAFKDSGFTTSLSSRMEAWLKTHAAFIVLVEAAVLAADGDAARLSRDHELLRTLVRAIHEAFSGLARLGTFEAPTNLKWLVMRLPEGFAVSYWRKALLTPLGELSLAAHAASGRAEMTLLAADLEDAMRRAAIPTPAIDSILARARLRGPRIGSP